MSNLPDTDKKQFLNISEQLEKTKPVPEPPPASQRLNHNSAADQTPSNPGFSDTSSKCQ